MKQSTILSRSAFPQAPVILGGSYATLCYEHARAHSGADHVVSGDNLSPLCDLPNKASLKIEYCPEDSSSFPSPAYDLYGRLEYASLRTSQGCPFRFTFCAIQSLSPGEWETKDTGAVAGETGALWHNNWCYANPHPS